MRKKGRKEKWEGKKGEKTREDTDGVSSISAFLRRMKTNE